MNSSASSLSLLFGLFLSDRFVICGWMATLISRVYLELEFFSFCCMLCLGISVMMGGLRVSRLKIYPFDFFV